MAFTMIPLPYDKKALEPYMSERTFDFHYGQHYKTYVNKLNELVKGTEYENMTLEQICQTTEPGPIYNNGAQAWNHAFFWTSMSTNGGGEPEGKLLDLINRKWGSYE
ncbi:MAG: superoxide dismutase, partial [Burkholderiales bacterium]|nr:superoxide dismutase [Burkholderiales bacterium]